MNTSKLLTKLIHSDTKQSHLLPKTATSKILLGLAFSSAFISAHAANSVTYYLTGARSDSFLSVSVTGSSTDAIYIYADVNGFGEFCYDRTYGWTLPISVNGYPTSSIGLIAKGKANCQHPAGNMSTSKGAGTTVIPVLNGMDLSAPLFNKTTVYVDIKPAGSASTAEQIFLIPVIND